MAKNSCFKSNFHTSSWWHSAVWTMVPFLVCRPQAPLFLHVLAGLWYPGGGAESQQNPPDKQFFLREVSVTKAKPKQSSDSLENFVTHPIMLSELHKEPVGIRKGEVKKELRGYWRLIIIHSVVFWVNLIFLVYVMLRIEHWASHMPGKLSTSLAPHWFFFWCLLVL